MNSTEVVPSDGPFVSSSVNTHPNFAPVKTPAKTPKPPKAPEKPLMPYMRYSREIWESVKAANPDQKLSEIGRLIGKMWREMTPHDKQRYIDDYEVDKVKYTEAFKIYQSSPAYQQYLIVKEKFQAEEKEVVVKGKIVVPKAEPRITLPACDNDDAAADELEYFHMRQLAAARFHRNQRLLQEVFSDSCVPDLRQIITTPRLISLKRQVDTLTMHQRKIETEVNQTIESFEIKKRRLEDGSREFQLTLEKCSKPALTSTAYDNMVEQAERQLLEKYRAYVKNIQQQNTVAATTINSSVSTPPSTESGASQPRSASPVKATTPVENGITETVVKAEPVELRNGEMNGNCGSKMTNGVTSPKSANDGESKGGNGVVANGVDHAIKTE